jgi:hypothetical protein
MMLNYLSLFEVLLAFSILEEGVVVELEVEEVVVAVAEQWIGQ